MPRHLNDADLPQITVVSSTEAPNLGTLEGSENFNSGTIGTLIEPNTFLVDPSAQFSGDITFEAGGYSGQCARSEPGVGYCDIEHSIAAYPGIPAATFDVKFKISVLPTYEVHVGWIENHFGEKYPVGVKANGKIAANWTWISAAYGSNPYETDYAITPGEWIRLSYTYRNNDTLTIRLWYGDNINGTLPDETLVQDNGSYGNARKLGFGKRDPDNTVGLDVYWDDLSLYSGVPDYDSTLPQRTGLQFAGAGISSMVDNPSTRSTDITVANNPSSVELEGSHYWADNQTLGTGTEFLDFGPYNQASGHLDTYSWIDEGASDLENGLLVFATQGLYRVYARLGFGVAAPGTAYAAKDLFSIMGRVYNPDDSLRYDVNSPVYEVRKQASGDATWWGRLALTDVMEAGSYITFLKLGSDQMISRSVSPWLDVRKLV